MFTFYVLFTDDYITTIKARDISQAWEKALDIEHNAKIIDIWID